MKNHPTVNFSETCPRCAIEQLAVLNVENEARLADVVEGITPRSAKRMARR